MRRSFFIVPLAIIAAVACGGSPTPTPTPTAVPAPTPTPMPAPAPTPVPVVEGSTLVAKWGSKGSDDGQFNRPGGIVVDASGNVYVADFENHRVQVFSPEGRFLRKWGSEGVG
jgi:DNA-binding beta-propeller fold protein YncE